MKRLTPLLVLIAAASSPAQITTITEYPLPVGADPRGFCSGGCGITTGPDGAIWFVKGLAGVGNKIGRITTTGALTEYPLPPGAAPLSITTGPDGAIWFTKYDSIGRITTTGTITEYAVPRPGFGPYDIVAGPDGALWFTDIGANKIGRITTTGLITEFAAAAGSGPQGITAGADGALWFTESDANKIGRITTTGVITEYAVPSPGGRPVQICAGPDGALWFTEQGSNQVGRITTAGAITMYPIPTPSGFPFGIAAGPDGAVWFIEQGGRIGRISMDGVITAAVVPGTPLLRSITGGPDGALWFTEVRANKIGRALLAARQSLPGILGFENGTAGAFPAGWNLSGGTAGTITIDGQGSRSGKYSARIQRTASSSGAFSSLSVSIPMDFVGTTIQWSGYIRTQGVSGFAAIWMREDGAAMPGIAFNSLQNFGLQGTTDWQQYTITLPVAPAAKQLILGFLLSGTGTAWVDDLELLVDGKPAAQAPARAFNTDHLFDSGSRISFSSLSNTQVANLATLAKVWGFLKYHHPAVASGTHQWDYNLFRIMPQVLAASDASTANAAISTWIAALGPVSPCSPCATLSTAGLVLNPNVDWISDTTLLGTNLSQTLTNIYRNRPAGASQFFISLAPNVGNPSFDNELRYTGLKLPDPGYQLLALFRFWNMVQYFYPYRDIMADDGSRPDGYWNNVLLASIPRVGLAQDSVTYQQELMRFIEAIHDTHANLWSSLDVRPPIGACQLPVTTRFVEGVAVVDRYLSRSAGQTSGLLIGDVIEQLDRVAVSDLVSQWTPLFAASNQAARLRDIGWYMTRGACGDATVTVRRKGLPVAVESARVASSALDLTTIGQHDLPGPTFQMLNNDVAYLKLSSGLTISSQSVWDAECSSSDRECREVEG